jgi:hypothetical protein
VEPDDMNLLSEHRGIVEAPFARVRETLLAVPTGRMPGHRAPVVVNAHPDALVVVSGGPVVFQAEVARVPVTIEVDRDAGWVQMRGQWWRCLRFQAQHHPQGALIIQRTYSFRTGRDAQSITSTLARWHAATGRQALARLLDALASQLACTARILTT